MIFSTIQKVEVSEVDFTFLATVEGRNLYISTDLLDGILTNRKRISQKKMFLGEIQSSEHGVFNTLELWLDLVENDILEMSVEEMELFITLYEMKGSEDLFLNLGEKQEGEARSIGEIIFVNSLADIINKGRSS